MCDCKYCIENKDIARMVREKDTDSLISKVIELRERLEYAELDLNVDEAVLAGKWPSAVEQLERALANAIKIRNKNSSLTRG